MKRTLAFVVAAAVLATIATAEAQQAPKNNGRSDHLLDAPYVTSTGATVPNPGKSQSGGTTPLDRKIQRENDKIDSGICKGC